MPPKGSKAAPKDISGEGPSSKKQKTGDKASKANGQSSHQDVIAASDALPVNRVQLYNGGQGLLLGFRVPRDYFLATGAGDTNEGGGTDPWETGENSKRLLRTSLLAQVLPLPETSAAGFPVTESHKSTAHASQCGCAGSYDLALEEAHIENFNVVAYTSVVPPEATEVGSLSRAKVCMQILKRRAALMMSRNRTRSMLICTFHAGEVRRCEAHLPPWYDTVQPF